MSYPGKEITEDEVLSEEQIHEERVAAFIRNRIVKMGIEIRNCRDCGREIIFMKTTGGKIMPISLNLVTHFYDCPQSSENQKPTEDNYIEPKIEYRDDGFNKRPSFSPRFRR